MNRKIFRKSLIISYFRVACYFTERTRFMNKLRYLILLIVTLSQTTVSGQFTRDIIKKSTHYFTLDKNDSITGDGAILVNQKISESQFFLIGEQHDIQQSEHFTKALIPTLKRNGFNNYATEIGPIAANKLEQLSRQKIHLKDFNSKYSQYVKSAPFGFFGTKEEEETLQQINRFNIYLLGIDFENYSSYLFLVDEIYKNANKEKVSEQLYKEVRDFIISEYSKGKNGYNPDLTKNLLGSKNLTSFLKQAENSYTRSLIEQFSKSLYINNEQTKGNWRLRVDNMKNNFVESYKALQKNQIEPIKIFFKFGAVHTARETSFSGFQEVGNTVYELSKFNQTKSFSIIAFPRYVYNEKTDTIEDVIEKDDLEILEFTAPDKWTLINLNELFKLSVVNGISLSKNITTYVEKYDAILIPPVTKYSEKNY